ncbi:MAG: DNA polymerase III subunit alpha [Thermoanaerobaculia bacterium]
MPQFAHLHLHSQYSLLDGANRLDDVLIAAREAGMPAVALTDHGNLFGAIELYNRAREHGVKPILGIEAYVAQGSRLDRDSQRRSNNHLVLLAENETGFRNLIKLSSSSFLEGFYYKPRIDHELLRQHSEGLIGLSACLKGEINERILGRQRDEAEATARTYREILGDGNFYLELQDHGLAEQRQANEVLRDMARRLDLPLVATNDCHYLKADDAFAHDVLLCIGTQANLDDPDRLRYASEQFYLRSGDEMAALFPDVPEAIENTLAIAERCHVELPQGQFHLPEFPLPAGEDPDTFFARVSRNGLDERLAAIRRTDPRQLERVAPEVYRERLEKEIEIIRRMGFAGYFLVVWDFIRFAREEGIPVGPGRGSAAGSLVAYSLRITDIDPLRYELLFERFLNPERISMPDIDIDFCMRRREEVIRYVEEKYGRDRVAQIITFGTLAAKAVVRDVGRVMGLPYGKIERISKLLPDMTRSLAEAARDVPMFAAEVDGDPEVRRIVEVGRRLEGLARHAGVHAAGVVITPRPIGELVPLYKTNRDEITTQWDKDVIESLGLLKMDFLGLRTLTVIDDTLKQLKLQGIELDLDNVPLDDAETYRLFREGRASGVFQFESAGMRDLIQRARPSRFEDLAAMNALYRPGALSVGMVEEYIQRKLGKKRVSYILPETRPILEETYGVIVYQEQVMRIAVEVAGFSLGEADVLRKAMGKKSPKVMAEQKEKFVSGAVARGVKRQKAEELWNYIEPFAGYGFNKSHSVAYALLAYKTAYLKVHYPTAFLAAMLTSEMGSKDHVPKYVAECRDMGLEVLPPDVNRSGWSFTVDGDAIRFGLGAVKGVGEGAVEAILAARARVGAFRSFAHLATEVDVKALNHRVFESLIKSGSFDSIEPNRAALLAVLRPVLEYAHGRQRDAEAGQELLFGAAHDDGPVPDPSTPPWSDGERLRCEKETLGFYVTGHPLDEVSAVLRRHATHTTREVAETEDSSSVKVAGVVSRVHRKKIKSGPNAGRLMGSFVLEDLEGTLPVTVFSDQLASYGSLLEEDRIVVVKGEMRARNGDRELRLEEIVPLEALEARQVTAVDVDLDPSLSAETLLRLRDLLAEYAGPVPVRLCLALPEGALRIAPQERFAIRYDEALVAAVESLIGPGHLRPHSA